MNLCSNGSFQACPPANLIFTGIGVLLLVSVIHDSLVATYFDAHGSQAVNDASANQGKLIKLFDRIEEFFGRLEIYTSIPLTTGMTNTITEVMVEVLSILATATKDVKRGRLSELIK